jgi:hypothetical protein
MSWVDLSALVLVLWCAAKGYLVGICQSFLHMCAVMFSVFVAACLQKSLLVYLNQEWQAEAVLVDMLLRNADFPLKAGTEQAITFTSSLSLRLMLRLWSGVGLPVAGGQETATASALAVLILWSASIFVLFLLAASIFTLMLRIIKAREQKNERREWQKIGGLIFGIIQGLALSVIFCLVLDVICCTYWLGFLRQDIYNSYLYSVTNQAVQLLIR